MLAVYYGSVTIRRGRRALAAGLLADTAGVAASLVICRLVFRSKFTEIKGMKKMGLEG